MCFADLVRSYAGFLGRRHVEKFVGAEGRRFEVREPALRRDAINFSTGLYACHLNRHA